jgi:hypothetical protein
MERSTVQSGNAGHREKSQNMVCQEQYAVFHRIDFFSF